VGYTQATPPMVSRQVTGADLVGEPTPGAHIYDGQRTGPFAFSDIRPPDAEAEMRAYVRRAQKALNQDIPVAMAEWSDDPQVDGSGTYRKPASGNLTSNAYAHVVTIFDLSVQTTEFGVLPAGVRETRPEALAASLRDDSQVLTFRTRNSYFGRYEPGASIA